MATKIEMRAGDVEFVFETDEGISVEDAKTFLTQIHEIAKTLARSSPKIAARENPNEQAASNDKGQDSGDAINLHVNSVAERLGAKTGSQVAMAAAAHLQLVEGKESFSRSELLDTMKEATNYYTQTMRSNLTTILKGLIGSKLNQLNNDHYSIKASELSSLRPKLAD